MKKLQSYIVLVLLGLFAVTVLPKELYHDCGHTHTADHSDLQHEEITEGDCPICDYLFSSPLQVDNQAQIDLEGFPAVYVALVPQFETTSHSFTPPLRGPPLA